MAVIKHGSGATSAFKTVKVSGQSDVIADDGSDDLTLAAGSNVTLTTNASTDTVTIAASGGATLAGIDDQSSSNDDQITIKDAEVVINEDGDDVDFRVESDGSVAMFVVNAGTNRCGIKTTDPISLFDINAGSADDVEAFSVSEGPTTRFRMIADFNPSSNLLHFAGHNNRTMMTFDTDGGSDNITGGLVGMGVDPSTAAEKLAVDGVVALKSQSSVPSVTAGYSKLFAKSDIGLDTSVLMHFDNNWNDSGAWGLAAGSTSGDPSFVTSSPSPKFGTHCAYFDGTGDFVDLDGDSDDPALGLGYDEWTIDFWISFPSGSLASNDTIIQSGATSTGSAEGTWRINLGQTSSAGDSISFDAGSTFVDLLTWDYGSEIADDKTWYHFAMVQHGGTLSFFLNGTKKASAENTNRLYTHGGIRIGADQAGTGTIKCYMDELRISKKAQWFNNFTPPTVAYGDSTLQAIDAHGNHTRLSPHNAQGEWEYYSKNIKTGKTVRINMEEVVRDLGELTGKDYIKDE